MYSFYIAAFNRIRGIQSAIDYASRSSVPLNPIILDMGSTWVKFKDYVEEISNQFEIIQVKNLDNPRYLWSQDFFISREKQGFFLSDADILYDLIPSNSFEKLISVSQKYPYVPKVGLHLRTDDLPNDQYSTEIKRFAKADSVYKISNNLFSCASDTTIAYYPSATRTFYFRPALRLANEYSVQHYPWYERSHNLDEEAETYRKTASPLSSTLLTIPKASATFRIKNMIKGFFIFILFKLTLKKVGKNFFINLYLNLGSYRGKIL